MCGPPLGLRQGHIDVKMLQNLISRSVSVKYSKIGITGSGVYEFNTTGGSMEGTICVLLPCQVNSSLWSDGTTDAVSHSLGQVKGAADQDVEDSFSGDEVMPLEKT